MQRGSVFRRASGSWTARWYEGRQRRQKGGFRTKNEATTWLVDRLERVRMGSLYREPLSVDATIDRYLAEHGPDLEPASVRRLRYELGHASRAFGSLDVSELTPSLISTWRPTLPPRSRHQPFQALRQMLRWAVARDLLFRSPMESLDNPRGPRPEIKPFGSWEEIEAVALELDPRFRAIPLFAAGTGLRPQEWRALTRGDIDRDERVVHVRRVHTIDGIRHYGKTERSIRRLPLRRRVLDALEEHATRVDTRILFPAARGGYIAASAFRDREWNPAVESAGLAPRGPNALRHTFATFAIASGISLFELSRRMGTSVHQIDRTYGHLLPEADDALREAFDAWDLAQGAS
jgi:integrase